MAVRRNLLILLRGIISLLQTYKTKPDTTLKKKLKYIVEKAIWTHLPRVERKRSQEDFAVYHPQVSLKFQALLGVLIQIHAKLNQITLSYYCVFHHKFHSE